QTPWSLPTATETTIFGPVTVRYEPELVDAAAELSHEIPRWWSEIEAALGEDVDDRITVFLTSHAGELAAASGMAPWATGVARPATGELIVAAYGPDGGPVHLEGVLRHELAHVALHRAVGGAAVPTWFHEGVADNLGEALSPNRREVLARGYGRGLPEIETLEGPFGGEPLEVGEAYAVSRDFVDYLRAQDVSGGKFHALIDEIRRGRGFERAVVETYGVTTSTLAASWRDGLWARFSWAPLATSPDAFLVLFSPLVFLAWFRRRRRDDRERARLARESEDFYPCDVCGHGSRCPA
ncbi:MAG: peptidase MA family metallohydrolase, partial [Nannocystaceae bacterium]